MFLRLERERDIGERERERGRPIGGEREEEREERERFFNLFNLINFFIILYI